MRNPRRFTLVIVAALFAGLAGGVVTEAKSSPSPSPHAAAPGPTLPITLQKLSVKREDITKTLAEDTRILWTDGVWLYSLRQGKELMATLELGHFKPGAPWQSGDFELSLAGQLGGSVPLVARLSGVPVYITATRGLSLTAWFTHGYMVILGVRATYKLPKDLIRATMDLKL